ncbi:cysteine hydrolase family protein [Microbacterium sp. A588]
MSKSTEEDTRTLVNDYDLLRSYPPMRRDSTALVVIDMVNWQIPRVADQDANDGTLNSPYFVSRLASLTIPNNQRLIEACRAKGVPVVFVRVGASRPDFGDVLPRVRDFYRYQGALDGTPACDVIDELAPRDDETTVLKGGAGAFVSSNLSNVLRNMGITHVIMSGVVTNGCITAAAYQAQDFGYWGFVADDATATYSASMQAAAVETLNMGPVVVNSTDELIELINLAAD